MQQTTNYNLLIPEGTDIVNPLTQVNPNFQTIDGAMFANKQAGIGTASEVVTGTVHAIIRNNTDSDVFRFTATGAWTAGDTMTLDGHAVTVHLSDGTTPATNSYIIGAEVLAMVNGSLVTLAISTTPPAQGVTSFNSRTGAVVPSASDYDGSMIDYDNTGSGLNATDVQGAIDELATDNILWSNTNKSASFSAQNIDVITDKTPSAFMIECGYYLNSNNCAIANLVIEVGDDGSVRWSDMGNDSKCYLVKRNVSVSAITGGYRFAFSDCEFLVQNAVGSPTTSNVNNALLTPYKIIAL